MVQRDDGKPIVSDLRSHLMSIADPVGPLQFMVTLPAMPNEELKRLKAKLVDLPGVAFMTSVGGLNYLLEIKPDFISFGVLRRQARETILQFDREHKVRVLCERK